MLGHFYVLCKLSHWIPTAVCGLIWKSIWGLLLVGVLFGPLVVVLGYEQSTFPKPFEHVCFLCHIFCIFILTPDIFNWVG